MKKNIKYLLFAVILLFSGCKYEEGPFISFRTACDRICREWEIERFYVDGADSLPDFQNKLIYCMTYKFDKDMSNLELYGYDCVGGIDSIQHNYYDGGWFLHENNRKISFGLGYIGQNYGPLFIGGDLRWTIIKLSSKEMWLEIVYFNNKKYEVKFKAK